MGDDNTEEFEEFVAEAAEAEEVAEATEVVEACLCCEEKGGLRDPAKPVLLRCEESETIYAVWGLFRKEVTEEDLKVYEFLGFDVIDVNGEFQGWIDRNTVSVDLLQGAAHFSNSTWNYLTQK